jgi:AraC family transcriptional regulator of adaptative response/methylated-DNA-[protein]-cysteine methyltransferase
MRDMNNDRAEVDYRRIECAIQFIGEYHTGQPSLEEIAAHVNMSPYHFQRLFTRWAGISPKKFLQYLTLRYAKEQLRKGGSLTEIAHEVGLSGSSRLHDLFITLEGMTPDQYRRSGKGITIYYGFHISPFGKYMLGVTSRQRICVLEFSDYEEESVAELENRWRESTIIHDKGFTATIADRLFDPCAKTPFCLLVKGTPFQLKVWEALLKIPFGSLVSYQTVSTYVDNPRGLQATGSAIGKNPIAYLIPCHRVVRKTGQLNGYRWGLGRKSALIGWEAAHL